MPKDEREELIETLNLIFGNTMNTHKTDYGLHDCESAVADFILADRKRIVEPLVKLGDMSFTNIHQLKIHIRKTLRNSVVGNMKGDSDG